MLVLWNTVRKLSSPEPNGSGPCHIPCHDFTTKIVPHHKDFSLTRLTDFLNRRTLILHKRNTGKKWTKLKVINKLVTSTFPLRYQVKRISLRIKMLKYC